MNQALRKTEAQQEIALFGITEKALIELSQKYSPLKEIANKKDYEAVRLGIAELRTLRVGIDKKRLELNADDQARIKARNGEAKRITEELRSIEDPLQALKNAEDERIEAENAAAEKAEEERIAGIRNKIDNHFGPNRLFDLINSPSLYIKGRIAEIEAVEIDEDGYSEFAGEAEMSKTAILIQVKKRLEERIQEEEIDKQRTAERARLEVEAKRQEAQQAEINRQMAAIEAQNKRIAEEKESIEQQKHEAAAAEQKRKDDEIARQKALKEAEEQAEMERLEAEARHEQEEKYRIARAEAEAQELARQEALKPTKQKLIDMADKMESWLNDMDANNPGINDSAACELVGDTINTMLDVVANFRNGIKEL